MIKEAALSRISELIALKKENKNIIIVNVGPDRIEKHKKYIDYQFPELSPEQYPDFIEKAEKFTRISETMRAWGETPSDRLIHALFKAFVDAYGKNAVYYKRHLGADEAASKAMNTLSALVKQDKEVILVSPCEGVPDHRFILMRILGPWRDMRSMMKQLKYQSKYYAEFATTLEEGRSF